MIARRVRADRPMWQVRHKKIYMGMIIKYGDHYNWVKGIGIRISGRCKTFPAAYNEVVRHAGR